MYLCRTKNGNRNSPTEAELHTLSYASKHLLWLKEALLDLQCGEADMAHSAGTAVVYADNQGTLNLVRNHKINDLTKHVAVAYHNVCNL